MWSQAGWGVPAPPMPSTAAPTKVAAPPLPEGAPPTAPAKSESSTSEPSAKVDAVAASTAPLIGPVLPTSLTVTPVVAAVATAPVTLTAVPTPAVGVATSDPSNPYAQYTAAQYAALTPEQQYALQQHWQQWQAYQQEYAKWHAQYGEQYKREMAAASTVTACPTYSTYPAYPTASFTSMPPPTAGYPQIASVQQPPPPPPDGNMYQQPPHMMTQPPISLNQPPPFAPPSQATTKISGQPQMYSQPPPPPPQQNQNQLPPPQHTQVPPPQQQQHHPQHQQHQFPQQHQQQQHPQQQHHPQLQQQQQHQLQVGPPHGPPPPLGQPPPQQQPYPQQMQWRQPPPVTPANSNPMTNANQVGSGGNNFGPGNNYRNNSGSNYGPPMNFPKGNNNGPSNGPPGNVDPGSNYRGGNISGSDNFNQPPNQQFNNNGNDRHGNRNSMSDNRGFAPPNQAGFGPNQSGDNYGSNQGSGNFGPNQGGGNFGPNPVSSVSDGQNSWESNFNYNSGQNQLPPNNSKVSAPNQWGNNNQNQSDEDNFNSNNDEPNQWGMQRNSNNWGRGGSNHGRNQGAQNQCIPNNGNFGQGRPNQGRNNQGRPNQGRANQGGRSNQNGRNQTGRNSGGQNQSGPDCSNQWGNNANRGGIGGSNQFRSDQGGPNNFRSDQEDSWNENYRNAENEGRWGSGPYDNSSGPNRSNQWGGNSKNRGNFGDNDDYDQRGRQWGSSYNEEPSSNFRSGRNMQGYNQGFNQGPNQGSRRGPNQGPNRGPNQGPSQESNQGPNQGHRQGSNQGMNRQQQQRPKDLDEEAFDRQFRQWEQQFEDWKLANANHPDRDMYRRYEQEFEKQRTRIMERREQMRKRKMEQMGFQPQSSFTFQQQNIEDMNFNQHAERLNSSAVGGSNEESVKRNISADENDPSANCEGVNQFEQTDKCGYLNKGNMLHPDYNSMSSEPGNKHQYGRIISQSDNLSGMNQDFQKENQNFDRQIMAPNRQGSPVVSHNTSSTEKESEKDSSNLGEVNFDKQDLNKQSQSSYINQSSLSEQDQEMNAWDQPTEEQNQEAETNADKLKMQTSLENKQTEGESVSPHAEQISDTSTTKENFPEVMSADASKTTPSKSVALGKRKSRFDTPASKASVQPTEIISLDDDEDAEMQNSSAPITQLFKKSEGIPGLDLVDDGNAKVTKEISADTEFTAESDGPTRPPKVAVQETATDETQKKIPSLFDIVVEKPKEIGEIMTNPNISERNIEDSEISQENRDNQTQNEMTSDPEKQPITTDMSTALNDPNLMKLISEALAKAQGKNPEEVTGPPPEQFLQQLPILLQQTLQQQIDIKGIPSSDDRVDKDGRPLSFAEWQRKQQQTAGHTLPVPGNFMDGLNQQAFNRDTVTNIGGNNFGDKDPLIRKNANENSVETIINRDGMSFDRGMPDFNNAPPNFNREGANFNTGGPNFNTGGSNNAGVPNFNVPNFGRGGPIFDERGPIFDRGGPNIENDALNLDRSGPNFDRGGPNFSRSGSNFDRNDPNFDRGGPNFDRGGPNFDRGGPNFDRGGPNFNRGGRNFNKGGPNQDRDGPNFGRGGSNFDGNGPNFRRDGPNFGRSGPPFGRDGPNFDGGRSNFGRTNPNFGGNGPNFGSNGPNFSGNGSRFGGRNGPNFGPNNSNNNNTQNNPRPSNPFRRNCGPSSYEVNQNDFRSGPINMDVDKTRPNGPGGDDLNRDDRGDIFRPVQVIDYQNSSSASKVIDYGHRPSTAVGGNNAAAGSSGNDFRPIKTFDYGHSSNANSITMQNRGGAAHNSSATVGFGSGASAKNNNNKKKKKNKPKGGNMGSQQLNQPQQPQQSQQAQQLQQQQQPQQQQELQQPQQQPQQQEQNSGSSEVMDSAKSQEMNSSSITPTCSNDQQQTNQQNKADLDEISDNEDCQSPPPPPPPMFSSNKPLSSSSFGKPTSIFPSTAAANDNLQQSSAEHVQMVFPSAENRNTIPIDEILLKPGRLTRPKKMCMILRGPPGSGKSYVAKCIKDKEVEMGGSSPRILSIDDYFLIENEYDEKCPKTGRKIPKKEILYEYDGSMEETYMQYLIKAFKKTIADQLYDFIIVDCNNNSLRSLNEFYCHAKDSGFVPYIIDLLCDLETCLSTNIHQRSEKDIREIIETHKPTPFHYIKLDVGSLLENVVEMEDAEDMVTESSPPDKKASHGNGDGGEEAGDRGVAVDDAGVATVTGGENVAGGEDSNEPAPGASCGFLKSKWETDASSENLARLDGVSKSKVKARKTTTMEDFLQIDDWEPQRSTSDGKKRVRWADIEEKRAQEKMRAIGFVVGQTDWSRMMDPNAGNRALNKTKYIERVNKRR